MTVGNNERVTLSKEDGGFYHCDIHQALLDDEVSCYEKINVSSVFIFRENGVLLQGTQGMK